MGNVEKLLSSMKIPKMVKVRQNFQTLEIENTAVAVQQTLKETDVLERIKPGDKVAIAVGSRGVADIPILVKEVVNAVKSRQGEPFILPAMGSHGGATAQGQLEVLEHLGVTEEFIGAPIRTSMEVVEIGKIKSGLPVYIDKYANDADKIIVINRIKPHTAFSGPFESGLMKIITIGLGKQKGADTAHQFGFGRMAEHVVEMGKVLLANAPIIFGLATIENAYDRPAKVVAVPVEKIEEQEPKLLLEAKSFMPRLMLDPIDVLIVDEVGKDISGSGMDPHITGRFITPFVKSNTDIQISRIVLLRLTEATQGNANGIGFADVVTQKLFDSIIWEKGYFNAFTSTVLESVKVPMFLPTERLAVQGAIKTCNAPDLGNVRVVRIKNTLEVKEILISENMINEALEHEEVEVLSEPFEMELN